MYGSGGTTGISGTAFVVRQLTSNQTHVMLRLAGMTPKQPVIWQIVAGAYCNATPTSTLLKELKANTVTTQGTVMTTDYVPGTINVTSGTSMMTVRVYDYTNNKIGTELACGQVYEQPSLGSNHWW
jgi:hypothetical protein